MNKTKQKNNEYQIIEYFVSKEKNFLYNMNAEAFRDKDFKFYIGWFIFALNDYMEKEYDIQERFTYFFMNNFSLNIIFFTYILSGEFRKRAITAISEYKNKFKKETIYE